MGKARQGDRKRGFSGVVSATADLEISKIRTNSVIEQ